MIFSESHTSHLTVIRRAPFGGFLAVGMHGLLDVFQQGANHLSRFGLLA